MPVVPNNKQWTQPNNGDSFGSIFSSYGIDLNKNRGSVTVSNPLKNVFDQNDNGSLGNYVAAFAEYDNKIWGISNNVFDVSTSGDITTGWAQDGEAGFPDPGATVTDAVVFDGLLLVQNDDDIEAWNGSTWSSWWKGTLGQSGLTTGQTFVLKVGSDRNLYVTDGGNKVHRVTPSGTVSIAGSDDGTLDFSATQYIIKCATVTSTRIFFGTEDTEGDNAIIIEWDMASQSVTANRLHKTGAKRVLCMATDNNDTPIAVCSSGYIKYFNGAQFVDWPNTQLPKPIKDYEDDVIHKNGWAIIDNMVHFLINPRISTNEELLVESTSNNWYIPAGVYCLDPNVGLYHRFSLNDDTQQFAVAEVGALFARNHYKTRFFASYEAYEDNSTTVSVIGCEDKDNGTAANAWLMPIPFEYVQKIIRRLDVVHKKLGDGDEINLYYTRENPTDTRIEGTWYDADTINTSDSVTGLEAGDMAFIQAGKNQYFLSTVSEILTGTTNQITFSDSPGATLNDTSVVRITNLRSMGSITNQGIEVSEMTIPDAKKTRQVWVLIEMKQAAGNDLQLDYLITS